MGLKSRSKSSGRVAGANDPPGCRRSAGAPNEGFRLGRVLAASAALVRMPVSSCMESSRFLWSIGSIVGYMMSALPQRNEARTPEREDGTVVGAEPGHQELPGLLRGARLLP
jgi:hypothetical protein